MDLNYITCNKNSIFYCSQPVSQKKINVAKEFINEIISEKLVGQNVTTIKIKSNRISYKSDGKRSVLLLSEAEEAKLSLLFKNLTQKSIKFSRDFISEKMRTSLQQKMNERRLNISYFYASGGGGHIAAKESLLAKNLIPLRKEIDDNSRFATDDQFITWCKVVGLVKEKDMLCDVLGYLGKFSAEQWNQAQIKGDIKKQERLVGMQWVSDFFFFPIAFTHTLTHLILSPSDYIVGTQPLFTPSILCAIKIYNLIFKPKHLKDVEYHLYLTDLPTKKCSQFFNSINRMTRWSGKECLKLFIPDLNSNIQKLFNVKKEQITLLSANEFPIRAAFLNDEIRQKDNRGVKLKISGEEELAELNKILKMQGTGKNLNVNNGDENEVEYFMSPEDEGYFIMLGSKPTNETILQYVNQFIECAHRNTEVKYDLFIAAGEFTSKKADSRAEKTLYHIICQHIMNRKSDWPENLRVVPLSFQNAEQIVGLEQRCHTITRSGGSTTMEFLALDELQVKQGNVSVKNRLIHSQQVEGRSLEKSLPLWERGNYRYLKEKIGAKIVSPKNILSKIQMNSQVKENRV